MEHEPDGQTPFRPPILDLRLTDPQSYFDQLRRLGVIGQDIYQDLNKLVDKKEEPVVILASVLLLCLIHSPEVVARAMVVSVKIATLVMLVGMVISPQGIQNSPLFQDNPMWQFFDMRETEQAVAARVVAAFTLVRLYQWEQRRRSRLTVEDADDFSDSNDQDHQ